MLNRRALIQKGLLATAGLPLIRIDHFLRSFPVRPLTGPPGYHWFGYYDKLQTDPADRFVLGMRVDFEHRSPTADDEIRIGMVDLHDGDRWIDLGSSVAWGWQQGCMLQWVPRSESRIIWNDRHADRFVAHLLNTSTGKRDTIPYPIYALSPDGRTAVGADFERIQDMRPGYGYPGVADPNRDELRPDDAGLYRIDLETGERTLIVSIARAAAVPFEREDLSTAKHYFNHLLVSPDGARCIFLHRWRRRNNGAYRAVGGFGTRMFTVGMDGSDLRVVDDSGFTSHFIWTDATHILAWTDLPDRGPGFYLFADGDATPVQVGADIMTRNGHCTFLPGSPWILNDTYPDENREQHIYLFDPVTERVVSLGRFFSPPSYTGEWRVDTHPRSSRDGSFVIFDSAHGGHGRQLYHIDLSAL